MALATVYALKSLARTWQPIISKSPGMAPIAITLKRYLHMFKSSLGRAARWALMLQQQSLLAFLFRSLAVPLKPLECFGVLILRPFTWSTLPRINLYTFRS